MTIVNFSQQLIVSIWQILTEAAPYVLSGFFAAGLIKALLPEDLVSRHLGENNSVAVVKASLLGIPLPLCSCGVIPAAVELRKQGAGRGPSAAFLVSTPESGVDSIAITWALLDPVMTLVRPLAAFLTATLTGVLINLLPEEKTPATASDSDCCCSAAGCDKDGCDEAESDKARSLSARLKAGLEYAFGSLLKDIGGWLLLGVAVAGVVTALIPDGFFVQLFDNQNASLLIMLLVGIPLYICASASTPVAAALILKGLSPGAALVFLLAGPATNAATLTVVARFWGRWATLVYLAVIAGSSLALGWLLNLFYDWSGLDITRWMQPAGHEHVSGWGAAAAILLLALIGRAWWKSLTSHK